jgi:hypothetical protein
MSSYAHGEIGANWCLQKFTLPRLGRVECPTLADSFLPALTIRRRPADHMADALARHPGAMRELDRVYARSHIGALARQHDVTVNWSTRGRKAAEAHIGTRQVWIPRRMYGVIDYLTALHEIGHVVAPIAHECSPADSLSGRLAIEGAAWGWALENADPYFADRMSGADWRSLLEMFSSHATVAVRTAKAVRLSAK